MSSSRLFVQLDMLKLEDITKYQIGQFTFKAKNNQLPSSCHNFISIANLTWVYNTRKFNYFISTLSRTVTRQKSISIQGPRFWDSLSSNI